MHGGEQAKAMVEAWTEGTQKIWQSWVDAFTPPTGFRPPPAGRLAADPEHLTSLVRMTAAAWQHVGRQMATAPGPQKVLTSYVEEAAKSSFGLPEEVATVTQDLGELWVLYLQTVEKLARPWFEAPTEPPGAPESRLFDSGLVRFGDLSWDVLERTFGRLLQSPSIGFTRELNEKLLGALSAWLEFRRANMDYQVALSAALTESMTRFLNELGALARKGQTIGSLRDLLRLWGDTLDGVLIESFRSEEYARVQGRLVSAVMTYRIREQEAMDVLLKIGHVPTRRDIDDVSRSLYELRKEVRAVSRAVAASGPGSGAGGPAAKPAAAEVRNVVNEVKTKPAVMAPAAKPQAANSKTGFKPKASPPQRRPSGAGGPRVRPQAPKRTGTGAPEPKPPTTGKAPGDKGPEAPTPEAKAPGTPAAAGDQAGNSPAKPNPTPPEGSPGAGAGEAGKGGAS